MKKKYLLFLIFTFIMLFNFIFIDEVSAAKKYNESDNYHCKYKMEGDGSKKAGFNLSSDSPVVHWTDDSGWDDGIDNWIKPEDGTSIVGTMYYASNDCPKYLIFTEGAVWTHHFHISNDDYIETFKSKYKDNKMKIYKLSSKTVDPKDPNNPNNPLKPDEPAKMGTSCIYFNDESTCKNGKPSDASKDDTKFACIWNKPSENITGGYCNVDNLMYVACGDTFDIPYQVPGLTSLLINLLKIGTPIILIIVSVITLLKALAASKEDEIKKAQSSLIKKVMAAVMVFFIITIVQFVISLVADGDTEVKSISSCMDCFINNSCSNNAYYKASVSGEYVCKRVLDRQTFTCNK